MTQPFNWVNYRNQYNMPVKGMSKLSDFNSDYVEYYLDKGVLYTPSHWRYLELDFVYFYYIEINRIARVYYERMDRTIHLNEIHTCVNFVQMLSQQDGKPPVSRPKGKLIKGYAPAEHAKMYILESGASLFLSHRHDLVKLFGTSS